MEPFENQNYKAMIDFVIKRVENFNKGSFLNIFKCKEDNTPTINSISRITPDNLISESESRAKVLSYQRKSTEEIFDYCENNRIKNMDLTRWVVVISKVKKLKN